MNYSEKAKQIVAENIYLTIATASRAGEPWVSPVFFAYDEHYNLYWVSNKEAKHSQLIADNPQVAIVIFDSTALEGKGDGVYFESQVETLSDPVEINAGMQLFNSRATQEEFRIPSQESVLRDATWRIYKAVPRHIYTLTEGKEVNGQYVDDRIEITQELVNRNK